MIWLGVVCSSFSAINLGTSRRSPTTPWGRTDLKHVRTGNALVSRSVLLILLCYALGGCWLLEQPGSSVLPWYPRFEYLRFCGLFHWSACWWQRHYGGLTPKRHKAWSNSPVVALLNRGVLTKKERETCKVQTTYKQEMEERKVGIQWQPPFKEDPILSHTIWVKDSSASAKASSTSLVLQA